jgi:hypothetical protein
LQFLFFPESKARNHVSTTINTNGKIIYTHAPVRTCEYTCTHTHTQHTHSHSHTYSLTHSLTYPLSVYLKH